MVIRVSNVVVRRTAGDRTARVGLTKCNLASRKCIRKAIVFVEVTFTESDGGPDCERSCVIGHDSCKKLVEVVHARDYISESGRVAGEEKCGVLENLREEHQYQCCM